MSKIWTLLKKVFNFVSIKLNKNSFSFHSFIFFVVKPYLSGKAFFLSFLKFFFQFFLSKQT